jgi:hypothetical protein
VNDEYGHFKGTNVQYFEVKSWNLTGETQLSYEIFGEDNKLTNMPCEGPITCPKQHTKV